MTAAGIDPFPAQGFTAPGRFPLVRPTCGGFVRRPVGGKVMEARVDVGPGYRLYYTIKGREMVVLLLGGDKKRQQADIEAAKALAAGLAK